MTEISTRKKIIIVLIGLILLCIIDRLVIQGLLVFLIDFISSFILGIFYNFIPYCIIEHISEYIELVLCFITGAPDASSIISILGIFATVSVTFLTLLFAISAINASFQAGRNNSMDSGAYPLKLLIKVDLQSAAIKTIIPQLIFLVFTLFFHQLFSNTLWLIILSGLLFLLVFTLWTTTNSVYYSIIQYNQDTDLRDQLYNLNKTCNFSMLKSYTPQPYDVYSIKKTLYPKIYKKVYTDLRDSGYLVESKEKLVEKWNSGFKDELKTVLDKIKETYPNETLVHAIQKENEKEENSLLEILTPKIQAPDKVTKICLDLIYQDSLLSNSKFTRYNIVTYQYCLLLLGSHKYYVESRQEERSKHNVLINRGRYTNPDDTHMYMLYGFILYRLGEFELKHSNNKNSAKEYYEKALSAYKCAKIANPTNNIADINLKILLNYVNRPPLSMNIS